MAKKYDVAIIGAGPGGMTAALYASRANLSVVMLDRGIYGGQMNNTAEIENYPGFDSVMGPDLAEKMYHSATQFGADYAYGNVVSVAVNDDGTKLVKTDGDEDIIAPVVIVATGTQYRKLDVPGEEQYAGRGVSYCAVCDGAFFKDQEVVVVGGGDSALEEGMYLAKLAKKVTIVHRRSQLRAQKILQDRAFATANIDFVWDSVVEEINGDGAKVTGVTLKNTTTGETTQLAASGVFIYVGTLPQTEFVRDLNICDEAGWVKTDDLMHTRVAGIFAIGDVRQKHLRQITTAVGDGGIAGQEAYNYIEQHE